MHHSVAVADNELTESPISAQPLTFPAPCHFSNNKRVICQRNGVSAKRAVQRFQKHSGYKTIVTIPGLGNEVGSMQKRVGQ